VVTSMKRIRQSTPLNNLRGLIMPGKKNKKEPIKDYPYFLKKLSSLDRHLLDLQALRADTLLECMTRFGRDKDSIEWELEKLRK